MKGKQTMRFATSLVLFSGIALVTGCANIVSKSQYPVTINSYPRGSTVAVKNEQGMEVQKTVTPATITLASSDGFFSLANYSFYFEKDGYRPPHPIFQPAWTAGTWATFCLAGLSGF